MGLVDMLASSDTSSISSGRARAAPAAKSKPPGVWAARAAESDSRSSVSSGTLRPGFSRSLARGGGSLQGVPPPRVTQEVVANGTADRPACSTEVGAGGLEVSEGGVQAKEGVPQAPGRDKSGEGGVGTVTGKDGSRLGRAKQSEAPSNASAAQSEAARKRNKACKSEAARKRNKACKGKGPTPAPAKSAASSKDRAKAKARGGAVAHGAGLATAVGATSLEEDQVTPGTEDKRAPDKGLVKIPGEDQGWRGEIGSAAGADDGGEGVNKRWRVTRASDPGPLPTVPPTEKKRGRSRSRSTLAPRCLNPLEQSN